MVTKKQTEVAQETDPYDEEDEEEMMDDDEEPEFDENMKTPKLKPKTNPPIQVIKTNKFAQKTKPEINDRYEFYTSPAVEGYLDRKTNQVIPMHEAITKILNILERIEENIG